MSEVLRVRGKGGSKVSWRFLAPRADSMRRSQARNLTFSWRAELEPSLMCEWSQSQPFGPSTRRSVAIACGWDNEDNDHYYIHVGVTQTALSLAVKWVALLQFTVTPRSLSALSSRTVAVLLPSSLMTLAFLPSGLLISFFLQKEMCILFICSLILSCVHGPRKIHCKIPC